MPAPPVLLDNTVLSNFAFVNRPELVLRLWGDRCSVTTAVLNEYQMGVSLYDLPKTVWDALSILQLEPSEQQLADQLLQLGYGERTCIAIAAQRNGLFVSDDAKARQIAKGLDVAVSGTLGILSLNVRLGHLPLLEGNQILQAMISHGYRTPFSALDDLI